MSLRYSPISLVVSARPNHVLHQNINGMSTTSHAVTKNRIRLRVDIRGRGGAGAGLFPVLADLSVVASGMGCTAILDFPLLSSQLLWAWSLGSREERSQSV